ncbi:hypothetical protein C0J52_15824 [Blattella germanica]|nr:hypothetical protein C0J52_15824 [Blattella germanica]
MDGDDETPEGSDEDELEDDGDIEEEYEETEVEDTSDTSSEIDEFKKSAYESDSSISNCKQIVRSTRSMSNQNNDFQIKSEGTHRTCQRCGKILTIDFCLCVYKIPFQCERCNQTFAGLPEFQMHMRSIHARNHTNKQNFIKSVHRPSHIKDEVKEVTTYINNVKHIVSDEHNLISDDHQQRELVAFDSPTVDENKSALPNTQHTQEVHACPDCKEVFNTKLGLMAHSLNHVEREETSTYKCNHCNREFTSTVRLSIHVTRMHVEEKKFVCDVCNKGFRLHDGGVESFPCNLCEKKFAYKSTLYKHRRRTHGIQNPHVSYDV